MFQYGVILLFYDETYWSERDEAHAAGAPLLLHLHSFFYAGNRDTARLRVVDINHSS